MYSTRVTVQQMEQESVAETKKALEELLQQNRSVLEAKKVATPVKVPCIRKNDELSSLQKKRLEGIKDMVSKLSPLKKRPASQIFDTPSKKDPLNLQHHGEGHYHLPTPTITPLSFSTATDPTPAATTPAHSIPLSFECGKPFQLSFW